MHCFFKVAAQDFAIPAENLLEIIPKQQLTVLPYSMPRLIGLHAHRGEIITLLTLIPLTEQQIQACKYILVMKHETGSMGIICDAVYDIQKSELGLSSGPLNPLCHGITQFRGRDIPIVDPQLALRLSDA